MKKTLIGFMALLVFIVVHAATTPSLSDSATYGVLSSTYTDTSGATTVNGDVGFTTPPATAPAGVHPNYGSGAPYSSAGTDQATVLGLLNAQPCDFSFVGATDLSLLTQPLTAGVYCVTGAQSVGTAGITLGSGTYIFRSTGALNTVANSAVTGGNACNVFWTPTATTLGANSTFLGTDIDDAGITVGAVTTWLGRALAFGGTITTDTDTITAPSCAIVIPPVPPTPTPPPMTGGTHHPIILATSTAVCIPVSNFSVSNRAKGDGQMELHWAGGNEKVSVWVDNNANVIDNTGYYEAKGLKNHTNYWFFVSNECSITNKIDPQP